MTAALKGAPNRVNVFERCLTPPGRSEDSAAGTTPCRLQLRLALAKLACYVVITIDFFFQQADEWRRELIALAAT